MILKPRHKERSSFLRNNFLSLLFFALFFACSHKSENNQDTATEGSITIQADESFAPVIKAQEYIFESLYPRAKLEVNYATERLVINSFLNGKSEMIVTGRPLNKEEIAFVNKNNFSVHQTLIASDAVVFIANDKLPDTIISITTLKAILNGQITQWNQINSSLPAQKIELVFDKSNSSNLLFTKSTMGLNTAVVSPFAAGSMPKVVEYVRNNSYSIGVIAWSWVSDEEDPTAQKYLKGIHVLSLEDKNTVYHPSQSSLSDTLYPLLRKIYAINKGSRVGLGSGFTTFMASDRGQRIILKSGILPATIPGREIEIKN